MIEIRKYSTTSYSLLHEHKLLSKLLKITVIEMQTSPRTHFQPLCCIDA